MNNLEIKIYNDNKRMVVVLNGLADDVKKKVMEICNVTLQNSIPDGVLPVEKIDTPPQIPEVKEQAVPDTAEIEDLSLESVAFTAEKKSMKEIAEMYKAKDKEFVKYLDAYKNEEFKECDLASLRTVYSDGFPMFKTCFEDVGKIQTPPVSSMSDLKALNADGLRNMLVDSIFAIISVYQC